MKFQDGVKALFKLLESSKNIEQNEENREGS